MTDIVGQAARVTWETSRADEGTISVIGANKVAQALADAGLLAQPARTVPTREELVEAVSDIDAESWPNPASTEEIADAVRALLAGQPTVAEVQEQWANYITNTTGSVGNNLTLESLVKALRAPHPPFGGPHKNEDQK